MITYELAKELKAAGFPQADLGGFNFAEDLNYPTLSELIEACGPTDNMAVSFLIGKTWSSAQRGDKAEGGSTPEEAVARLWLALNKPSKCVPTTASGVTLLNCQYDCETGICGRCGWNVRERRGA